jgi:hypothetical protein
VVAWGNRFPSIVVAYGGLLNPRAVEYADVAVQERVVGIIAGSMGSQVFREEAMKIEERFFN